MSLLPRILRRWATYLSFAFHPVLIPTYAIALLLLVGYPAAGIDVDAGGILVCIYVTLLLTAGVFIGILSVLLKLGIVESVYMSERMTRVGPYWCSVVVMFVWCCVLRFVWDWSTILVWLAGASTCVLLVVTIINYWWKISAHLAVMGALLGSALGYSHYVGVTPLITSGVLLLLSLLLMYARILLKEHTPAQTAAGLLLGITLTYFPSLLCP